METTHPAARIRPPGDYEPGPLLIDRSAGYPIYRVRDPRDADFLLRRDDHGGVTQGWDVIVERLRAAGVQGLPEDHEDIHEIYKFVWGKNECPIDGQGGGHGHMLGYIEPYLSKSAVDGARADIRELTGKLLDVLLPNDHGLLDVAQLARLLAFRSAAALAGLPCSTLIETTMMDMFDRFTQLEGVAALPPVIPAERTFVTEHLLESGARGLIADLVTARKNGDLTDADCMAVVRGFLYAGTDTTGGTFATLLAMIADPACPDWQQEARNASGSARQKMIRRCALEAARLYPTFPQIPMFTVEEVTLPSGQAIPPDHQVMIVIPAINRSPEVAISAPGDFRPDMRRHRSLAFGKGLHACAGEYLALAVIEEGVGVILDRTKWVNLPDDGFLARAGLVTWIGKCLLDCTAA